jgi:dTDP-4-dehydrorhamnose reductase
VCAAAWVSSVTNSTSPTLAIIGANGQLGSAIVVALGRRPRWRGQPLTHRDVEIADRESIARALDPVPDVVVNTAFWPGEEPEPALRTNALGPRLLAEHCASHGALLVHVSTDYVFDGESSLPYREDDPTAPRSVYGVSKLAGEQLVRGAGPRHIIARLSYLYGPVPSRAKQNSHIVSAMLDRVRREGAISAVMDQVVSPTYAPDAAETLLDLVERGATGTFHISNAGACSVYEFAGTLTRLAGLDAEVRPVRFADLPASPPRPRSSALAHDALHAAGLPSPRPWQEALAEYVAQYVRQPVTVEA